VIVVLVLIVYGISVKGLGPLIEEMGGQLDEVWILLHVKDDVSFERCYFEDVAGLGGGPAFFGDEEEVVV